MQLIRDKNALQSGASIQSFKQEIGRAYQVIVIFSEKSLTSEHCMRELTYLHQTSLADKSIFQQRVIPVVANEVNIDNSPARLQYVTHWRQLADQLAETSQGISDAELTAELNLYNDIANSLFSSLKWASDILLSRHWDPNENGHFSELIQLI